MTTKKKQIEDFVYSAAGVGVTVLILIAVNLIASAFKERVDLTQEHLYTLSPGTKAILAKLDTPVKIRFYYTQSSSQMPMFLKNYAREVEDLLDEYQQRSHGEIQVEKLDPEPDTDAEDSARLDGVEGQMINLGEKIYLGLAFSCVDQKTAIPFLSPDRENLLEYDISRAISQVATPEKPVIGVMSSLPVFGQPPNPMMMRMGQTQGQQPWLFVSELKRDFQVQKVDMDTDKIDDKIKVLLVVHPKNISDKAQFAIDQFVLRGGKLIAFLDPMCVMDRSGNQMNPMQRAMGNSSTMDKLLKAWGLKMDTGKVLADMNFVSQINRGRGPEEVPSFLSIDTRGLDTNDVIMSQIDNLMIPFGGVFTGTPPKGIKETVLIHSTDDSQLVDKFMAQLPGNQISKDFTPADEQQAIAVRLTGKFKTAFPDGQPEDKADNKTSSDKDKTAKNKGKWLKEGTKPAVVVLVADADMLYDQFCARIQNFLGQKIIQPINGNLNFVQSLTEQMAGDSNLIEVRSRATLDRPFLVVKKMQAAAQDKFRSKIKQLQSELSTTQQRLSELQRAKKGNQSNQQFILSPQQQQEIDKFRKKEADVNRQLRQVRKNLRSETVSLETRLKWINIAGMPMLVTLFGIGLALIKRKRTSAK